MYGDLPFNGLDDHLLVEEVKNITQHQSKPTMQDTNYHQVGCQNFFLWKERVIFRKQTNIDVG